MSKKGFTLIELLAVIVILAIIALIATPIVLNIIKDSRDSATLRSAENYMDAVNNAIATTNMKEGGTFSPTSCDVNGDGNLACEGQAEPIVVDVDKEKPIGGTITFNKGKVEEVSLTYSNGKTVVNDEKGNLVYEGAEQPSNTTILCRAATPRGYWFYNQWDPEEATEEYIIAGEQATSEDPYKLGAVYSCDLGVGEQEFYVLKEDGDNVKLISYHSMGEWNIEEEYVGQTTWCPMVDGTADTSCQGSSAKDLLLDKTKDWTKLNLEGVDVELPNAYDIANALGYPDWDGKTALNFSKDKYWISVNINTDDSGSFYGNYWTSTNNGDEVFFVTAFSLSKGYSNRSNTIRPVIVIPKENMSLE